MPNKDGQTSIYRIDGLKEIDIYEIGRKFVADLFGKPLMGRADIGVWEILNRKLSVKPDPIPHLRHGNIIDWPNEKSEKKLIAMELADEARLHLVEDS